MSTKFALHIGMLLGLCVLTGIGLFMSTRESDAVEAVVRVAPTASDSTEMYRIYKETHVQLLKSAGVITNAIRRREINTLPLLQGRPDPVSFVRSRLVSSSDETELIRFAAEITPWESVDEWATLVDAILASHQEVVVRRETFAMREEIARLRRMKANLRKELTAKRDQFLSISETLGTGPQKVGEQERTLRRLEGLEKMLVETRAYGLSAVAMQQNDVVRKLESTAGYLMQEVKKMEDEIEYVVEPNGELTARQADISALKLGMLDLSRRIRDLEVIVDGPKRVTVIQDASLRIRQGQDPNLLTID